MKVQDKKYSRHVSDYLGLSSIPGIGEVRFRRLLKHFQSPENVFNAGIEELMDAGKFSINQAEVIKKGYDRDKIDEILNKLSKNGIKVITIDDHEYPGDLKQIYDPPPVLYYKGDISAVNTHMVAIVGSRKASAYGKSMAEKISAELAEAGFTIVSGFARGIDSIAHRAALESGGLTVAVMGCGLDIVYPPENRSLIETICESGCIISEFNPGVPPEGRNFPKRNRIISGIVSGVVIVEAAQKSGALLTARHALEQGREVFAIPGPANSSSSDGTNHLIKNGAKLTVSGSDILEELKIQLKTPLVSKSEKQTLENLTGEQRLIYQNLDSYGLHVDKLANSIRIEMSKLLSHLLEMELSGYVKALSGKRYARC